jgi:hypothetical protein
MGTKLAMGELAIGRTNPQSPEQVPVWEVVLPPLPLSVMTKRTYVPAGGKL